MSRLTSSIVYASGLILWASPGNSHAAENFWINPSSGNWTNVPSWSLGSRPDASQSIKIVNDGWKAVEIGPTAPLNFPASMTVADLTISNDAGKNVLLLNYAGTSVPLRVLNGLSVFEGGEVRSLSSGLVVDSGFLTLSNSQMVQEGGFVTTTNAPLRLQSASYYLTNGTLQAGQVNLGLNYFGSLTQHGGAASATNMRVGTISPAGGPGPSSTYDLISGYLYVSEVLRLSGQNDAPVFIQRGGTNFAAQLLLEPPLSGGPSYYYLMGGRLCAIEVALGLGGNAARINQTGGEAFVTNTLALRGGTAHGTRAHEAVYSLANGSLTTRSLLLDGSSGFPVFAQTNGITRVSESIHLGGSYTGNLMLYGGTLICSNITWSGSAHDIDQTGGALIVSNLFSFGGVFGWGGAPEYRFDGGTLTTKDMELFAQWYIGSSSQRRITNTGSFKMGFTTLHIGDANEQLGRFILATNVPDQFAPFGPTTNSIISLDGNSSRLSFANSSAETWTPGGTLIVRNWNGNPAGGGAEQLKFGNSASGLTPAQLSVIRFELGSPPASYSARILATGEVVPGDPIAASLAASRQGNSLVLSWPSGWTLQSSTNVIGSYQDVQGATSPYTNVMSEPKRFFRLRSSP